jgi:hypothetical protein
MAIDGRSYGMNGVGSFDASWGEVGWPTEDMLSSPAVLAPPILSQVDLRDGRRRFAFETKRGRHRCRAAMGTVTQSKDMRAAECLGLDASQAMPSRGPVNDA